ncbi:MAG TPA: hypothetical protein VK203_24770 [Nostocaceae cyanobacterium]|nr:hypothetical protein [Nostocaceae cyanobacterium]
MLNKSIVFIISGILSISVAACSNTNQSSNSASSPTASTATETAKTQASSETKTNHINKNPKGQIVESGKYHLEFVPELEKNGTHLDFYLQTSDNHQSVPNAKVTAQVQLPDGTQKTLPLTYDADGKHYAALLPSKAPGKYQIKVTSDIKGEKVDGRFNFSR